MMIRVVLAVLTYALAIAAAPPSFAADMPVGRYCEPADVAPYFVSNDSMSVSHPTGRAVY